MQMTKPATQILFRLNSNDPQAAQELAPLVYDELRRLASQRLAQEKPGQTLGATALVHEAYLRLVDVDHVQHFSSRGHFFAAAAEAMRRILIESARKKKAQKRGGGWSRNEIIDVALAVDTGGDHLFAVDEALSKLAAQEPEAARLVELRFFAGLTLPQAAEMLDISLRTANRQWSYARAWLRREIDRSASS
jgi:RNA polymerase sigma factor (TIGR02999 family)